jgi:enamine deaminase RidA (YjgF/YER057c/UK114 family)
VFLAGSCPVDDDGTVVGVGDVAAQARRCVENMIIVLAEAGAELTDVVGTRVLVASPRREDLVAAWQGVRHVFWKHDAPSTLLGVTVLGYESQLVEIEAVAAVLDREVR